MCTSFSIHISLARINDWAGTINDGTDNRPDSLKESPVPTCPDGTTRKQVISIGTNIRIHHSTGRIDIATSPIVINKDFVSVHLSRAVLLDTVLKTGTPSCRTKSLWSALSGGPSQRRPHLPADEASPSEWALSATETQINIRLARITVRAVEAAHAHWVAHLPHLPRLCHADRTLERDMFGLFAKYSLTAAERYYRLEMGYGAGLEPDPDRAGPVPEQARRRSGLGAGEGAGARARVEDLLGSAKGEVDYMSRLRWEEDGLV